MKKFLKKLWSNRPFRTFIHGRCELQTNGTLRVKTNVASSNPFFTVSFIWAK